MSSYQNTSTKKAWKWTTAKIVAFSAFGILAIALVYLESAPDRVSTMEPVVERPAIKQEEPSSFDKQYQEFLKRGKKIVSEETLDSIERAETVAVTKQQAPKKNSDNADHSSSVRKSKTPTAITQSTSPEDPTPRVETRVENNLKPVQLSPASNNKQTAQTPNVTGSLEEIDPPEINTATSSVASKATDNSNEVITEEFYVEESISGTVSAISDRMPIQGVNIVVKGTSVKTVSDANGKYSITVPGDPLLRTISYSYQGKVTERDVAPGTEILNIRF